MLSMCITQVQYLSWVGKYVKLHVGMLGRNVI
jgi:hypothetical protein